MKDCLIKDSMQIKSNRQIGKTLRKERENHENYYFGDDKVKITGIIKAASLADILGFEVGVFQLIRRMLQTNLCHFLREGHSEKKFQ